MSASARPLPELLADLRRASAHLREAERSCLHTLLRVDLSPTRRAGVALRKDAVSRHADAVDEAARLLAAGERA